MCKSVRSTTCKDWVLVTNTQIYAHKQTNYYNPLLKVDNDNNYY